MRVVFLTLSITLLMLTSLTFAQGATIILVSDNPADFAVATVLAGKLDLDITVTPWGTLSNESVQEIIASKCVKAYVIGGSVAVPGAEDALKQQDIAVERVGGVDRYETSALVAEKWNSSSKIFIAEGYDEQGIRDAIEKAKPEDAPIVFVKAKEVPQAVTNVIARLNVSEAMLIPAPDMNITEINASIRAKGVKKVDMAQVDFGQRAQSAIDEASLTISNAEANISEIADAKSVAAFRLLEKAKEHFRSAKEAFGAGGYGEAFGRAVAARTDAENSIRILSGVVVGDLHKAVEKAKAEIEALVIGMNIGDITKNPAGYEGKDVQVRGDVISEPIFIGGKTYVDMHDETGRILVEKEGFMGPPLINTGDKITVTGKVRLNVALGGGHDVIPYLIEATDIQVAST